MRLLALTCRPLPAYINKIIFLYYSVILLQNNCWKARQLSSKKFKRKTGVSPRTYRIIVRVEKETGIKLSKSQVSRILAKEKYVYIWGKYSLEDKQDKKKEKCLKKN